jgi:hypothetical protein
MIRRTREVRVPVALNPLNRGRMERAYFILTGIDAAKLDDKELMRRLKIAQELAKMWQSY